MNQSQPDTRDAVAEDWSVAADFLDEIEVDKNGMCRWADVANAQTNIRHCLRSVMRRKPDPDGWAFVKELSDALLKIRPLGGSELFVNRNGQYYADPVYCGQMIDELRKSLDKEIRTRIRAEKASLVSRPEGK